MLTDPIADMLTRIRNASAAEHAQVDIPGSRLKREIARVLKDEGFIRDFEWIDDGKRGVLRIYLKYGPGRDPVINTIRRVSTPGRRIYVGRRRIPRVRNGLGLAILTTPRGVMSDKEARRQGVGGEVICYVW